MNQLNDLALEERILESDRCVAVAFLHYSSAPCDHFRPELQAVSKMLDDKVEFCQIDVTENPTITEELGVQAVPTLLVFREGDEIARYEGPYSQEALFERISTLLAKTPRD